MANESLITDYYLRNQKVLVVSKAKYLGVGYSGLQAIL